MNEEQLLQLIAEKKIDTVKSAMSQNQTRVNKALKEYDVDKHAINYRQDKQLDDGKTVNQHRLPIAYQKKIVQSAVAFLFGKPIKFKQESEGTDNAFNMLINLRRDMRMSSKDQDNAEKMKSETESAKLFVGYRDDDADPEDLTKSNSVKCILLAKSLGDTLYTLFDDFGVMKAFARGYRSKDNTKMVERLDIYLQSKIYHCKKITGGWDVQQVDNLIGKIPVVYYSQKQAEWSDVQRLIERREMLTSRRADNNDYSGDAILVVEGDAQKLPDKSDAGKMVQVSAGGKVYYLYPQMVVDLVKDEKEDLKELIHYLTDTPDLSMEKMAAMGQDSGKALQMRFFGALLKAMGQYGYFQEMIDREVSILKAYMGKIVDVGLNGEADKLNVSIEFGNPLPDSFEDYLSMLTSATAGKAILSQKTAVSLNPLVNDPEKEIIELNNEEVSTNPDDI